MKNVICIKIKGRKQEFKKEDIIERIRESRNWISKEGNESNARS